MSLDISSIVDFLAALWQLWSGALTMQPSVYQAAVRQEAGFPVSLVIALIGGISLCLGQSVVLFANRIPRRRFLFSLLAGALAYLVLILLWALSIWLISAWVLDRPASFESLLTLVGLSLAPLSFGFLILLPYLGSILYYLLVTWVLASLLSGLDVIYGFNLPQAFLAAGLVWLVVQVIAYTRLVERLLWRLLPGYATSLNLERLAMDYVQTLGE
jgi:hypothetical protein